MQYFRYSHALCAHRPLTFFGVALSPSSSIFRMKYTQRKWRQKEQQHSEREKIVCLFLCAGVDNAMDFNGQRTTEKVLFRLLWLRRTPTHRHAWGRTSENTRGEFVKIWATNTSAAWCLMQAQRRPMTFCSARWLFFFCCSVSHHFCRCCRSVYAGDAVYFP